MTNSLPSKCVVTMAAAGCLVLSSFATTAGTAAGGRSALSLRVGAVTKVAQLVGPTPSSPVAAPPELRHSIVDTTRWGVCGGDLGSLTVAGGAAYITLGDNYTTCPPGTGGPASDLAPPDWRSNALGIVANPSDFTHGLRISRWYSAGGKRAAEVIPSQHNAGDCQDTETAGCEVTAISTYTFAAGNHLFLAYMSVHHWGAAAQWDVNYSSFAMSPDWGRSWQVERKTISWGAKSNFAQVAVAPDPSGTHLLFYGIPGGRFGAVKLMRTANTWQSVLEPSAYQYFTGTTAAGQPLWSTHQARAVAVASAPVGELSVIYDQGLKLWLMTYLQGGNDQVMPSSDDIVIRSASHYWGPWSAPVTLASHNQFPQLYGAFMDPHFVTGNGHTIYFVMSLWGPYSIFWMRADLMLS